MAQPVKDVLPVWRWVRGRALLQLLLLFVLLGSFIAAAVDSGDAMLQALGQQQACCVGGRECTTLSAGSHICTPSHASPCTATAQTAYLLPCLVLHPSARLSPTSAPPLASCSPSCLTPSAPGCSPPLLPADLLPSTGAAGASYIALTGDLPGALLAFKTHYPILAIPVKAAVAFPIIYHYLGGLRHFAWDLHKIGNNADRTSLLETPRVEQSSQILLGSSIALTLVAALM